MKDITAARVAELDRMLSSTLGYGPRRGELLRERRSLTACQSCGCSLASPGDIDCVDCEDSAGDVSGDPPAPPCECGGCTGFVATEFGLRICSCVGTEVQHG